MTSPNLGTTGLTFALAIAGMFWGGVTMEMEGAALVGLVGFGIGHFFDQRKLRQKIAARLDALEISLLERAAPAPAPQTARPIVAPAPAISTQPVSKEESVAPQPSPTPASPVRTPTATSDFVTNNTLVDLLKDFATSGNAVTRVGVILLLLGTGFLVKYAAEQNYFPIELRLASVALGAIAMVVVGFRLRHSRTSYAMSLEGGGIGILYVIVTASLRIYHFLPASAAFALFVSLAIFGALLAVVQNSLALAMLASIGAFAAPILASTGGGSHVSLFSYYTILNTGILLVAFFKTWRPLNLLGFAFTFGIGTAWGVIKYEPRHFVTCQIFLALFFVMYVALSLLFALRRPQGRMGAVDGTLVFGTPFAAFALEAGLVQHTENGLAIAALVMGLFYTPIALLLWRRAPTVARSIVEAFIALGLGFATLALPLGLGATWSSGGWALEGLGLVWVGLRQSRLRPQVAGIGLILAAGVAFLLSNETPGKGFVIANGYMLTALLVSLSTVWASWLYAKRREEAFGTADFLASLGSLFLIAPAIAELEARVSTTLFPTSVLVLFTVLALLHEGLGSRLKFAALRAPALLLPLIGFIAAVASPAYATHPFAQWGFVSWSVLLASAFVISKRNDHSSSAMPSVVKLGAVLLTGWTLVWVLASQLAFGLSLLSTGSAWLWLGRLLPPVLFVMFTVQRFKQQAWPFQQEAKLRLTVGSGAVLVGAFITALVSLGSDGQATPLPYLPGFSPAEVGVLLVLGVQLSWQRTAQLEPDLHRTTRLVSLAFGFLLLTAMVGRSVHTFADVPYTAPYLWRSAVFQAAISLTFSTAALLVMLVATRKMLRPPWVFGASVLGGVVIKLVFVDLPGAGTLARIVSFVGVGVLFLVIGYVAPFPQPKVVGAES